MTEIKVTKKVLSTIITILILALATPAYAETETLYKAKEIIAEAIQTDPSNISLYEDGAESPLWENILLSDNEQYTPAKIYYYNAGSENVVIAFDVNSVSNATGEYKLNGLKGFPIDETSVRFYAMTSLSIREIDNIITLLDRKIRSEEINDKLIKYKPSTNVHIVSIEGRSNQSEAFTRAKEIVAKSFDINSNDFSLFRYGNGYYLKPLYSDNIYLLFTTENISKGTDIREFKRKQNTVINQDYVIYCEISNADLNASAIEIVSAIDNEANQTLSVEQIAFWIILFAYAIIVGVFFGSFFLVKKIMTKKR